MAVAQVGLARAWRVAWGAQRGLTASGRRLEKRAGRGDNCTLAARQVKTRFERDETSIIRGLRPFIFASLKVRGKSAAGLWRKPAGVS